MVADFPGVISHMPVSEQCDKRLLLGALCPVQVGCEMTCSCRKTRSQESRRKYVAPRCRINDLLRFPIHFRSSILSRFSEDSAFSTATPVRNSYMLPGRSAADPHYEARESPHLRQGHLASVLVVQAQILITCEIAFIEKDRKLLRKRDQLGRSFHA